MASAFKLNVEVSVPCAGFVSSATASEVARRYRSGESLAGIAASLGLGRFVVRRILARQGIPLRPRRPASGPHLQAILAMHAGGKSIKEISAQLGLNFATVYRVLRQAGRVHKKAGRETGGPRVTRSDGSRQAAR